MHLRLLVLEVQSFYQPDNPAMEKEKLASPNTKPEFPLVALASAICVFLLITVSAAYGIYYMTSRLNTLSGQLDSVNLKLVQVTDDNVNMRTEIEILKKVRIFLFSS